MKLSRRDGWGLLTAFIALSSGIYKIISWDLSQTNTWFHIKLIYIILWSLAIVIAVWLILKKTKEKKNGKKRTR